jgi:hypothetical protein
MRQESDSPWGDDNETENSPPLDKLRARPRWRGWWGEWPFAPTRLPLAGRALRRSLSLTKGEVEGGRLGGGLFSGECSRAVPHATKDENSTNPHQLPPSFLGEGWGGGYFQRR